MRRIPGLVIGCGVLLMCAPWLGESMSGPHQSFVLWQLRVPRVLMGLLVGGTLALVGAVYQQVFSNPLATPSTTGTLAGATLGALAVIVLGPSSAGGLPLIVVAAFSGALAASLAVSALASMPRTRIEDVLLAGIGVSLATTALATGLQYSADSSAAFAAAQWSLGHLPQVGYRGVVLISPFILLSVVSLLTLRRALQALAAGEDVAHAQGVEVARLRTLALGMGALGVSACVAWCGPIGFVGLIVPHLVRLLVGPTTRVLLPMSCLLGGTFLVACDVGARLLLPGRELPVGVVTAGIGAPALIALIWRSTRERLA